MQAEASSASRGAHAVHLCHKGQQSGHGRAGSSQKLTKDAHEPLSTWFPVLQHPVLHCEELLLEPLPPPLLLLLLEEELLLPPLL